MQIWVFKTPLILAANIALFKKKEFAMHKLTEKIGRELQRVLLHCNMKKVILFWWMC